MIRRNPHVFNNKNKKKYSINEINKNWERIKKEETNYSIDVKLLF